MEWRRAADPDREPLAGGRAARSDAGLRGDDRPDQRPVRRVPAHRSRPSSSGRNARALPRRLRSAGDDIEANTRRVLERYCDLDWERLALTREQVFDPVRPCRSSKTDRRYNGGRALARRGRDRGAVAATDRPDRPRPARRASARTARTLPRPRGGRARSSSGAAQQEGRAMNDDSGDERRTFEAGGIKLTRKEIGIMAREVERYHKLQVFGRRESERLRSSCRRARPSFPTPSCWRSDGEAYRPIRAGSGQRRGVEAARRAEGGARQAAQGRARPRADRRSDRRDLRRGASQRSSLRRGLGQMVRMERQAAGARTRRCAPSI